MGEGFGGISSTWHGELSRFRDSWNNNDRGPVVSKESKTLTNQTVLCTAQWSFFRKKFQTYIKFQWRPASDSEISDPHALGPLQSCAIFSSPLNIYAFECTLCIQYRSTLHHSTNIYINFKHSTFRRGHCLALGYTRKWLLVCLIDW